MAETPAGWHKDANGVMRWWDGTQWTEQTQPDPPAAEALSKGSVPPPPAGPPVGAVPPSPYGSSPSGGGPSKKVWWIVGGIAAAVVVVVGGVIGLIVHVASNVNDGLTSASKSMDAAQSELNDWATSSDEPEPTDDITYEPSDEPTEAPGSQVTVPQQPRTTFTPDPSKKYPKAKGYDGIRRPTLAEAKAAPKTADQAKFCQAVMADYDDSKDEWAAGKQIWEKLYLGTPPDMSDLARQGWEEWIVGSDGPYEPGSPQDEAYIHYTFPC